MGKKNSFVVYDNWSTLLCGLPDDEAGKLIKAICSYKLGNLESIDNPIIAAMFNMIKDKLDEDAESYDETCKQRAENGKKGAAKRWGNGKPKQMMAHANTNMANDAKRCQTMADTDTDTDTDNDNDTDTDNENVNVNEQKKPAEKKRVYGANSHVKLTDREYDMLTTEYGVNMTLKLIDYLDGYIEEKPRYKTKSHYMTIKRWVVDAVYEQEARRKPKVQQADDFFADIRGMA